MDYSRTFGSTFPNNLISYGNHRDIDNNVVSLVNQYNAYLQAGNVKQASQLYETNKEMLDPYILNMSDVNRLEEEIFNTGLYALSKSSSVVSDSTPVAELGLNSYWFSDY